MLVINLTLVPLNAVFCVWADGHVEVEQADAFGRCLVGRDSPPSRHDVRGIRSQPAPCSDSGLVTQVLGSEVGPRFYHVQPVTLANLRPAPEAMTPTRGRAFNTRHQPSDRPPSFTRSVVLLL